jgi:hypothetical protein
MRLSTRATTTLPLCPDVVERLGDTNAFAVCSYLLGDGGAKSGGVALARVAAVCARRRTVCAWRGLGRVAPPVSALARGSPVSETDLKRN